MTDLRNKVAEAIAGTGVVYHDDDALAAEDAAISAMNEWRPIEEAPKDREILVTGFIYNDRERGRWYETAAWNGCEWATEYAPVHPPTHWMPLPLPPPPEGE